MSGKSQAILHHPDACDGRGAPVRQIALMLLAFVLLLPILSALGLSKGAL